MTLGVKKNITQLLGYLRQLTPSAIGEMQEWMLMDLTGQQRESIDHLQFMCSFEKSKLSRRIFYMQISKADAIWAHIE